MNYPRPTAQAPEIKRVQVLYQTRYGVTLSSEEAKELLERVMQFIYLTEVEDAIHPLIEDAIHPLRTQVQ